jgi:predicted ABC-type ATPase
MLPLAGRNYQTIVLNANASCYRWPKWFRKTTLTSYLTERGRLKSAIINPDEIAFKEFGNYNFHIKAARVALGRRKQAIENGENLAFETTFPRNSEINEVVAAKSAGYKTILYMLRWNQFWIM